jgi:hypothetical protein
LNWRRAKNAPSWRMVTRWPFGDIARSQASLGSGFGECRGEVLTISGV